MTTERPIFIPERTDSVGVLRIMNRLRERASEENNLSKYINREPFTPEVFAAAKNAAQRSLAYAKMASEAGDYFPILRKEESEAHKKWIENQ